MSAEWLAEVYEHSLLDGADFAVHAALAYLADDDGMVQLSSAIIAGMARLEHSRVRRILPTLERAGLFVVVARPVGEPALRAMRATQDAKAQVKARSERAPGAQRRARASRARTLPLTKEITQGQEQDHVDEALLDVPDRIDAVLDAWCESTGRRRASVKRTPKRVRIIAAALRDYPFDEVLDAVRGWQYSSFHTGENDRHQVYNDIELLLRDGARIEKFRDLQREGPPRPRGRLSPTMQNLRVEAEDARRRSERDAGSNGSDVVETGSTDRGAAGMAGGARPAPG